MLAPVIIFVYARPDHVKKTIATLKKNYLVNKTEIFIYSDAAKNENTIQHIISIFLYRYWLFIIQIILKY